jgi:hypothetical protein
MSAMPAALPLNSASARARVVEIDGRELLVQRPVSPGQGGQEHRFVAHEGTSTAQRPHLGERGLRRGMVPSVSHVLMAGGRRGAAERELRRRRSSRAAVPPPPAMPSTTGLIGDLLNVPAGAEAARTGRLRRDADTRG